MKSEKGRRHAKDYVAGLASRGRYHFSSRDARVALGVSSAAAKLALGRLAKQGLVASPARGFHVIVPPEYRSLGCLPAEQFIPGLMEHLGLSYYAGLLSAAQVHGAAHHRPQAFQVFLAGARRPLRCGAVRVTFLVRKALARVPVQRVKTPRGTILVSTPEATAIDLVGYQRRAGGLDQVATVLSELAERLDAERLVAAAETAPVPWAQRLGHLLERLDAGDKAVGLRAHVQRRAREAVPLLPGAPSVDAPRDKAWKLRINAEVEAEL